MQHLGTLLDTIDLPFDEGASDPSDVILAAALGHPDPQRADPPASGGPLEGDAGSGGRASMLTRLAADLPAGHLHVWGGPSGAGKTSFLLSLLHGAAVRERPVVYATYDLPVETLAMRLLAMLADVDVNCLPDPGGTFAGARLSQDEVRRLGRVRAAIRGLPFYLIPARGFSVASLTDRIVRTPVRPQVLVVDYVQAIIREPGTEVGAALRSLSDLAVQHHLAILGVFRALAPSPQSGTPTGGAARSELGAAEADAVAARVGWIAPSAEADGAGAGRAEILSNQYGGRPSMSIQVDPASGRIAGMTEGTAGAPGASDATSSPQS